MLSSHRFLCLPLRLPPEYPEKNPGDELQKIRFKTQARLEPAQYHWWQAKKADVLTVTPRVTLQFLVIIFKVYTGSNHPSSVNGSAKCDLNSFRLTSWAVPSCQMAHGMLHAISARCVARDLHRLCPGHLSVRVRDSSWLSEEIVKNLDFPFNAIILLSLIFIIIIINVKLKDRFLNTIIRQRVKVTDIGQYVTNTKEKWAGHIARMKDNRWTIKSTEWQIKGVRSVGRPKRRWRVTLWGNRERYGQG